MPAGQLYIKTKNTVGLTGAVDGWVDAYTAYGLSLDKNGLSRLRAPAPNKGGITVALLTEHGANTLSYPDKKDVRQVSLGIQITALDKTTFNTRYHAFCTQVLDAGYIRMKHEADPDVVYHFKYIDCPQYTEFLRKKAKFMLSLEEPRPDVRTETGTIGIPPIGI